MRSRDRWGEQRTTPSRLARQAREPRWRSIAGRPAGSRRRSRDALSRLRTQDERAATRGAKGAQRGSRRRWSPRGLTSDVRFWSVGFRAISLRVSRHARSDASGADTALVRPAMVSRCARSRRRTGDEGRWRRTKGSLRRRATNSVSRPVSSQKPPDREARVLVLRPPDVDRATLATGSGRRMNGVRVVDRPIGDWLSMSGLRTSLFLLISLDGFSSGRTAPWATKSRSMRDFDPRGRFAAHA